MSAACCKQPSFTHTRTHCTPPDLPIPSLIPLPNLQRLYFKVLPPIDTTTLELSSKDADSWQALYDSIRGTGEQCWCMYCACLCSLHVDVLKVVRCHEISWQALCDSIRGTGEQRRALGTTNCLSAALCSEHKQEHMRTPLFDLCLLTAET